MKYYKQLDEIGEIITLFTYDFEPNIINPHIVEIAAEEYKVIIDRQKRLAHEQAEIKKAAQREKTRDLALKAKAYDIIVGEQ